MEKKSKDWIIAGAVAMFLLFFVLISAHSYISELKEMLAKSERKNTELEENRNKLLEILSQKYSQSSKVERCLAGTLEIIDALQKKDEARARQYLLSSQATCQEASKIMRQPEEPPPPLPPSLSNNKR
jgi:hypothetical protein